MGREVRKVPASWQHPKDARGRFVPLHGSSIRKVTEEFEAKKEAEGWDAAMAYFGRRPYAEDYMPDWSDAERTHLMMYETCSEGTPLSPAFGTPEELARWLADNNASAFGQKTASYEQWLRTIRAGGAPSAAIVGGRLIPGVAL